MSVLSTAYSVRYIVVYNTKRKRLFLHTECSSRVSALLRIVSALFCVLKFTCLSRVEKVRK